MLNRLDCAKPSPRCIYFDTFHQVNITGLGEVLIDLKFMEREASITSANSLPFCFFHTFIIRYSVSSRLIAEGLVSALVFSRDDVPKEISDAFGAAGVKTTLHTRPNQYLKTVWSPGDSFATDIGSNGNSDWHKDSGRMDDKGFSRYSKAWPEQLRDHPGWGDLQGDRYRRNNFGVCVLRLALKCCLD
jgi:hypothetical protein